MKSLTDDASFKVTAGSLTTPMEGQTAPAGGDDYDDLDEMNINSSNNMGGAASSGTTTGGGGAGGGANTTNTTASSEYYGNDSDMYESVSNYTESLFSVGLL